MLIVALMLAVVGLAALVFAVVSSNALVAWVCIGASVLGVLLLMVDALRERRQVAGSAVDDSDAGAGKPGGLESASVAIDTGPGGNGDGVALVDSGTGDDTSVGGDEAVADDEAVAGDKTVAGDDNP